jgi:hypothetical protein
MRKEPPLPHDVWDRIPPDAQAAVLALVERYERKSFRREHPDSGRVAPDRSMGHHPLA